MRNEVLSHLSASDFHEISDHLEPCRCSLRDTLVHADAPISHVYFPESGIVSIVAQSTDGLQAEVGLIGREGFLHPAVILGTNRIPHRAQMQVAGDAHRIALQPLMAVVEASEELRQTLMLFAQTLAVQSTCTTLANAVQQTEYRLGRWLLMVHDRSDGDSFCLTHEFMAVMLSVRRPSVTNALHILEGLHLIRSERGLITIRDRDALEHYVGSTYGRPEAEYSRLLWPLVTA